MKGLRGRVADILQEVGKIFLTAAVVGGFVEGVALDAVLMLVCASAITFLAALQVEVEGGYGQD